MSTPSPSAPAASAPAAGAVRPAPLRVVAGACTDVGSVRVENQDSYGALPTAAVPSAAAVGAHAAGAAGPVAQPALFIVADGMGGHEAGGEASQVAVAALIAYARAGTRTDGDAAALLGGAIGAANAAVWARANTGGHLRRMGTTCTVLLVAGGRATVGHVGDSRAYRVRGGVLEQLTTDHTVAEAARSQPGFAEVARARRHHLTRALGVQPDVQVDAFDAGPALPDDRFVLCSDGLEPVPADELRRAVGLYSAQEAAEWLVALASARGSRDNATAVVVHVLA